MVKNQRLCFWFTKLQIILALNDGHYLSGFIIMELMLKSILFLEQREKLKKLIIFDIMYIEKDGYSKI